jgi:hypothetical protein
MELVDIRLTGIQRRNRAAFVRRSEIPGAPELSLGQKVVLRDEEGEYFAGTVLDVIDEAEELFLVHLGVRLPEEFAMMRLGRMQARPSSAAEQDVLDLLGDARDVLAGRMPLQRQA